MPERIHRVDRSVELTNRIIAHYNAHARDLPWRSAPGRPAPDPYHVWLSEIMLQQTTVAAVKPYFHSFTQRWPSVAALAAAKDEDVMQAWAGLGYYARARNLIACARLVAKDRGGHFPQDETELLKLPGIGPYTAAAIASIAFDKRAVVVDGNVERVIARLFAIKMPLPVAKADIRAFSDQLTPDVRAGDFAQAMMDMGATICTPRSPRCDICPVSDVCQGREQAEAYPVKSPKTAKPERSGTALWIAQDNAVLLIRRPEKGLLGGMRALPSFGWDGSSKHNGNNGVALGSITHVFTHFRLILDVIAQNAAEDFDGEWWPIDQLDQAGLPTVFKKAAERALGELP